MELLPNATCPLQARAPHANGLMPNNEVSGRHQIHKRQPEAQEDFEFLQKLGMEFGNSSSHPNFFGGGFMEANSDFDNDMHQGGSSSLSYSREFYEESFKNPNLLSILQSKDQQQRLH